MRVPELLRWRSPRRRDELLDSEKRVAAGGNAAAGKVQPIEKRRLTRIGKPSSVVPTISWVVPGGNLPVESALAASPRATSAVTNARLALSLGTIRVSVVGELDFSRSGMGGLDTFD
jgi:hypothetical protein